jgi:hypothetical protein
VPQLIVPFPDPESGMPRDLTLARC